MRARFITILVLFICFSIQSVRAEDAFPAKIDHCVACHGALGKSHYGYFPNLAGQKMTYMINQLKAFRDGTRSNPWMTPIAVPLTDREIEELANFYSQL